MTRILLTGHNKLLTDGLRALFERETDFTVIGSSDLTQAGANAKRLRPDIVIADLSVQALDTPAVVAKMHKQAPRAKLVVLSISLDPAYVSKVITAGASGFVLKCEPFDAVMRAIRAVIAGRCYL